MCWNLGPTHSFEYEFSYCMREPWLFNVCDWKWDLCTHFLSDIPKLVFNIHSDEKKLKWPLYSIKEVIYGGNTEVPGLLSLPHTRLHFFFSFPCDIAVLIWLHWWFLWERDYFRILKLAQERCWHLFLSKSGSACHWLCYKVPPILISGKECSQASPSDRCTILLSMGSCKYMTKNVPRKVEQWLVPLPLKRILVHHQTRQVWIIISPYFPPLKIPLVLELYRF